MIVIGIIAAILALGMPNFKKPTNNIKKVTRELLVLAKEVRHYARLKNSTYRIALKMGKGGSYWVEAASGNILVKSEENLKYELELSDTEKPKSPFTKTDKPLKKEKELSGDFYFSQLEIPNRTEPITKDMAYIHFSPEGMVENCALQITDGKNLTWTLIFNPLTGQADIVEKAMSLKDAQEQK